MDNWHKARVVARATELPPAWEPGLQVAVSLAACGVRVWADHLPPQVLDLATAQRVLALERGSDGLLVSADNGRLEDAWSRWFSA
jgi:hypothetical protein